jgi:predicted homoserine dehydrogenase-like protein
MIILDKALEKRAAEGRPIRVGMIGAGAMGRGCANQIVNAVQGMDLVAIANRTVSVARRAYDEAGREGAVEADTLTGLEDLIRTGIPAITSDFELLCQSGQIDAILELTGSVEFGARACLAAIAGGKHFITMNAELDGTLGPLMRRRAEAAGVIYSVSDGDQPGVQMNLWRHVRAMGLTPLVCGNVKGLHDPYRTPETQKGFAEKWGQDPAMVTSFADGTKISFEQAIVANATGMCVARRGMGGRDFRGHVDELTTHYDIDELKDLGGVVDYVVGAQPGPGVFVLASHDDPRQKHLLNLYKLGEGPLYSFYTPYHLCHFEVPFSIARAVDFGDTVLAAPDGIRVDVVATAKTDLKAGQTLDGFGGFLTYGLCENAPVVRREGLLPIGLAEGCTLTRDVAKDSVLGFDDVRVPQGRLIDALRAEQDSAGWGTDASISSVA